MFAFGVCNMSFGVIAKARGGDFGRLTGEEDTSGSKSERDEAMFGSCEVVNVC